jgi:hypothetical protein
MKHVVLTVLLALMQASPPVPRQTPNADAGKGQAVQGHSDADKKTAEQGTPAVPAVSAPPNENANHGKSSEDAEKAVTIRELPPVSVTRDWMDVLALAFSGILLIVGIFGVRAAYRTLRAVEGQVQAQLEALRARITVGFAENPFPRMAKGQMPNVVAKLINTGGTPAYDVVPETWIEVLPVPFEDFTPEAAHFKGGRLSVYPTQPLFYDIPLARHLTKQEWAKISAAQCYLCVRIRITYRTLNVQKYCDFAFSSLPNGMEQLSKYHDAN